MATDATKHSAFIVGKAFTTQYYNVLYKQPSDVHKFYRDESRLSRAEGLLSPLNTVTSMQAINEIVMSRNYSDAVAIKSVDSQESFNGGVLVVVTGSLSYKGQAPRNFVQTFFLAPQDPRGFYVLNDICRLLDLEEEEEVPEDEAKADDEEMYQQPPAIVKHAVNGVPEGREAVSSAESIVRDVIMDEASQQQPQPLQVEEGPEVESIPPVENGAGVESEVQGEHVVREVPEEATRVAPPPAPAPAPAPEPPPAAPATPVPPPQATAVQSETPDVDQPASAPEAQPAPVQPRAPAATGIPPAPGPAPCDGPAPKRSWAFIAAGGSTPASAAPPAVRAPTPATVPSGSAPPAATVAVPAQPGPILPPPQALGAPGATASAPGSTGILASGPQGVPGAELGVPPEVEAEAARSVFIRNLPAGIRHTQIGEYFSRFGSVKVDRIQIRQNKVANPSTVYAFVEFEEAASAKAAAEVGSILVEGNMVRIEEKKATGAPGAGPAGNRGGGYRRGGDRRGDRPYRDGARPGRGPGAGPPGPGPNVPMRPAPGARPDTMRGPGVGVGMAGMAAGRGNPGMPGAGAPGEETQPQAQPGQEPAGGGVGPGGVGGMAAPGGVVGGRGGGPGAPRRGGDGAHRGGPVPGRGPGPLQNGSAR